MKCCLIVASLLFIFALVNAQAGNETNGNNDAEDSGFSPSEELAQPSDLDEAQLSSGTIGGKANTTELDAQINPKF